MDIEYPTVKVLLHAEIVASRQKEMKGLLLPGMFQASTTMLVPTLATLMLNQETQGRSQPIFDGWA